MSTPSYSVVRDPLFTFMLSRFGTYFRITSQGGYVVDGLGNVINVLGRGVQIKKLDQNETTIVQTAIFKLDQTTSIRRVVLRDTVEDTGCPGEPGCGDDCWSLTDDSFDAYIDGVTLDAGYYILTVTVSVTSGTFTVG